MNPGTTLKEQVQSLLQLAEDKKKTSTAEAIKILEEVKQLLPQLQSDNDRRSDRNITQHKGTQEIIYISKRGNILYEVKDYQEAAACYLSLKAMLPKNSQVYKAYGDCLRKQQQYDEAIKQYQVGLDIYENDDSSMPPQKAALLNSRGLAYMELNDYTKALADFEEAVKACSKNALYHCNKGYAAYALGERKKALDFFLEANELVKSGQLGDLTGHNIDYIKKTLQEFIQEIEALTKISLPKEDSTMAVRLTNFVKKSVEALSRTDSDGQQDDVRESSVKDQGSQLRDAAHNLSLIQADQRLFQYYDGFMFTLQQSYSTAVIVDSGQFTIDTSCTPIEILTKAVKLVPLVGSQISDGIGTIKDFLIVRQVTKCATNVCSLSPSQSGFEEIVQDPLCQLILEEQARIMSLKDTELNEYLLPSWAKKFKSFAKLCKFKGQIEEYLYGNRNKTPLQKFAHQTAANLVSEFIASGKIYGNDPSKVILPKELKIEFKNVVRQVIDQSFKAEEDSSEPKTAPSTERSSCCQTF